MSYVDGYVLPVPRNKIQAYRRLARQAGAIWREHGALEYRECVGDDLEIDGMLSFPRGIQAKADETIIFAWIVFKSKAHRNRVNAKVMQDPRLSGMNPDTMPFDCKRILYGGFKTLVEA